ncbi:MAG: hypothetical protein ACRCUP_05820 [Mycoplasmatales bacterium]
MEKVFVSLRYLAQLLGLFFVALTWLFIPNEYYQILTVVLMAFIFEKAAIFYIEDKKRVLRFEKFKPFVQIWSIVMTFVLYYIVLVFINSGFYYETLIIFIIEYGVYFFAGESLFDILTLTKVEEK